MNKGSLGQKICIFLLLSLFTLSSVPIVLGIDTPNSEISNINSGLPDFVIEDIFIDLYYNGPGLPYPALFCRIRNIGDAPVSYIRYNVVVKQILLNIIPTRTITSENFTTSTHPGMPPGGTYIGVLPGGTDIFPLFGFFRFHVTMNPDRAVNESNYDNNYYAETFFEWHPPIFGYVRWYSLE